MALTAVFSRLRWSWSCSREVHDSGTIRKSTSAIGAGCFVFLLSLAGVGLPNTSGQAVAGETNGSEEPAVRTWFDKTGTQRRVGTFVDFKNGRVRIRSENGEIFAVPLEAFSKLDQEYVRQQSKRSTDRRSSERSKRARRRSSTDAAPATGEDWPQFRGPRAAGSSSETGLPTTWSVTENMVWKTALPGFGASSPITIGDLILLTCYSGYGTDARNPGSQRNLKLHTVCIRRRDGEIAWGQTVAARLPEQDYKGSWMTKHGYASGTPVTDGDNVYAFFGASGVLAYDLKGRQLWHADVGSKTHGFGTGASPIVYEGLVIVNASIESGSLIALNKKNGRLVWHADGIRESWNTPVLVDVGRGRQELVLMTRDRVLAFDPANGQALWSCAGSQPPRYICPSIITDDGIVYALNGLNGPFLAMRAGGRGDVSRSHQLWSLPRNQGGGSNVPSPVLYGGNLYWANENGVVHSADAKTGRPFYRERLNPSSGLIYASPLAADGKIYYVSRENGTYVLAAKSQFELLAHNTIAGDDSVFNASPLVSQGCLLLRSDRFLYCIGTK